MSDADLMPWVETSAADWLVEEQARFEGRAGDLVTRKFDAYVRVFHRPGQGLVDRGSAASWADVARSRNTQLHPAAQYDFLAGWDPESTGIGGDSSRDPHPLLGTLDPLTLRRLVACLQPFTGSPDSCWLALWEGFGRTPTAWDRFPRFTLPYRSYWLFHAPLSGVVDASVEFEAAGAEERSRTPGGLELITPGREVTVQDQIEWVRWLRTAGSVQSPNLWWPEDHAWIVASEIDYDTTIVAGSNAMAAALVADPGIESLLISPETSLSLDADLVNRQ